MTVIEISTAPSFTAREVPAPHPLPHTQDEHCANSLNEYDACTECGVSHCAECDFCRGKGFHKPDCDSPEMMREREMDLRTALTSAAYELTLAACIMCGRDSFLWWETAVNARLAFAALGKEDVFFTDAGPKLGLVPFTGQIAYGLFSTPALP